MPTFEDTITIDGEDVDIEIEYQYRCGEYQFLRVTRVDDDSEIPDSIWLTYAEDWDTHLTEDAKERADDARVDRYLEDYYAR